MDIKIPILHLCELLALSFGYKPEDFGMMYGRATPVTNIIEKVFKK